MTLMFDFESPRLGPDNPLLERLRARIARRPGRWRRRMRRQRERRESFEAETRQAA
ncbi:MAG: hypothetical protein RBU30_06650 [Polyangia bacterium]|jgi:hypothetical protein|nr:hypothetical protein [Polyangia bacterium]